MCANWRLDTIGLLLAVLMLVLALSNQTLAAPGDHVGHWGDGIHTVAVDGNRGVINEGTKIRVMDLSNPTNPVMRGTVELGVIPSKLMLYDTTAYAASAHGRFFIIDILNQDAPVILGQLEMECWPESMWVRPQEDYAYVGECSAITVVDVSVKSNPRQVRRETNNLSTCVYNLTGDTSHLYAVSGITSGHLSVWSLASPAMPAYVGHIEMGPNSFHKLNALACSGNAVYWGTTSGLFVIDVSDKAAPAIEIQLDSTSQCSVYVFGGKLYQGSWGKHTIYDLANPLAPQVVGVLTGLPEGHLNQLSVQGSTAYEARADYFHLVNVASPTNPTSIRYYSLTPCGNANAIALDGDTLFVAGHQLSSLSIADPVVPSLLDSDSSLNWVHDMVISANCLYVANGQGIEIWDVSDPSNLVRTEVADSHGGLNGRLGIEPPYLSACNGSDLAVLFEILASGSLNTKSQIQIVGENVYATALKFPAMYALTNSGLLYVYDISDPTQPSHVQTLHVDTSNTTYHGGHDMAVSGEILHVLLSRRSYSLFSIQQPLEPARVQTVSFSATGDGTDVCIDRNKVYIARGGHGGAGRNDSIAVFNIEDPLQAVQTGFFSTPAYSRNSVVHAGYMYVSCSQGVVQIYEAWPTPPSPPSQPDGTPVLAYYLRRPSIDPEGLPVLYTYRWTSDGGDSVTHGPKADLFDVLTEWDLVEAGETWTITVTPSDGSLAGQAAIGRVKVIDNRKGTAVWQLY